MTEHEELRRFFLKTLIAVGVVALLWAAYLLRDLLLVFMVAFLLAAALAPLVDAAERRGIPRLYSVIALALSGLGALAILLMALLPALIAQVEHLLQTWPEQTARLTRNAAQIPFASTLLDQAGNLGQALQSSAASGLRFVLLALESAGHLLFILVLAMFLVLDAPELRRALLALFPAPVAERINAQLPEIMRRLSAYVAGQALLSAILAGIGMVLLAVLHVPYALLLGVLLGLFSVIPLIGPYLGMIPALAVALLVSPWTALLAGIVLYLLIHVVGTFVAPVIFRRSLNLSPLLMILSLAAGYRLGGLAGMILAVPAAAILQVLVVNLYLAPKLRREGREGARGPD